MVSWGLRILACVFMIPPATPIGLLLWYWAHRREKKSKQDAQTAENIEAIKEELEDT